jgi:hypothetical protein
VAELLEQEEEVLLLLGLGLSSGTAIPCPAPSAHATCTAAINGHASYNRQTFPVFIQGNKNIFSDIILYQNIIRLGLYTFIIFSFLGRLLLVHP